MVKLSALPRAIMERTGKAAPTYFTLWALVQSGVIPAQVSETGRITVNVHDALAALANRVDRRFKANRA